MDWQQALRARALADSPLDALVGNEIHWVELPQGVGRPNLLLTTVADTQEQHLKGFTGTQPAQVQFDARADSAKEAWDVMRATIAALTPGQTGNGFKWSRGMVTIAPRDQPDRVAAKDGASKTVFRVSADLTFHHAAIEEGS